MNIKFKDSNIEMTLDKEQLENAGLSEYLDIVNKVLLFLKINSIYIISEYGK